MIEADNTGRLYRSNSSSLSLHGSFRMMKGFTTTNTAKNNSSETNATNNNSQSTSLTKNNLTVVACESKTRGDNNIVNVTSSSVINRNTNATVPLSR